MSLHKNILVFETAAGSPWDRVEHSGHHAFHVAVERGGSD